MSEPVPAPAHEGVLAHVREWFEKDIEPDLEKLRADAERSAAWVEANSRNLAAVADTVAKLAEAAFPAAAPEIAALLGTLKEAAGKAAADLEHFLSK